jgi:hypothetical protein
VSPKHSIKLRRPLLLVISEIVSELFINISYWNFEVTPKKEFSGHLLTVMGVVVCDVHGENYYAMLEFFRGLIVKTYNLQSTIFRIFP